MSAYLSVAGNALSDPVISGDVTKRDDGLKKLKGLQDSDISPAKSLLLYFD